MTFEEQVADMRDACDYCGGLVFKELAEDIAREADQRIVELETTIKNYEIIVGNMSREILEKNAQLLSIGEKVSAESVAREDELKDRISELEKENERMETELINHTYSPEHRLYLHLTPIEPQPEWCACPQKLSIHEGSAYEWIGNVKNDSDGCAWENDVAYAPTPTSRPVLLDKWYWYQEGERE